MKTCDLIVKYLENEGVDRVFGIPGEETLDFTDSPLSRSKIAFVLTLREQAAPPCPSAGRKLRRCLQSRKARSTFGCMGVTAHPESFRPLTVHPRGITRLDHHALVVSLSCPGRNRTSAFWGESAEYGHQRLPAYRHAYCSEDNRSCVTIYDVTREGWSMMLSVSIRGSGGSNRMQAEAPFAGSPGCFGRVSGRPFSDPRQQAAFTFLELLVALAIMGIIAAFALPAYSHYVAQSRQTDAQRQLMVVAQAQEIYRFQNGAYATNAQTAALIPYGWLNNFNDYTFTITNAGTATVNGVPNVPVFTAQAAGNIDSDATIDTWTIDQTGTLINVINDVIQ